MLPVVASRGVPWRLRARVRRLLAARGPPRKVTDAIKRRLANGLPGSRRDYELDHLIPIGLEGDPRSLNNLWLQTWPEAAVKDRDELRLHRALCAGRMTLEQAQHEMLATWAPRE